MVNSSFNVSVPAVARRLRDARKHKNRSQFDVSVLLFTTQNVVSDRERCAIKPKLTSIAEMAMVCEVNPIWLITGIGDIDDPTYQLGETKVPFTEHSDRVDVRPSQIANRLAYARYISKLTQRKAAEKMGLTRNTIYYWENQKTMPELDKYPTIASVYDVDPVWLMTGYGQP